MIGILLVDDHKLMRDGMRALITEQPGMRVVGEAQNGDAALELAAALSPDVILMDISMPQMNGMEATRRILETNPEARVIGLSMHLDRRMALDMLGAGAVGYLLKDCAIEEVVRAVEHVATNGVYLSPKIVDLILKEFIRRFCRNVLPEHVTLSERERVILRLLAQGKKTQEIADLLFEDVETIETQIRMIIFDHIAPVAPRPDFVRKQVRDNELTRREREILTWIRDGKSTYDIASIYGVTPDTVKYHLKRINVKLNASNRAQALAQAIERKIIDQ
jgi:DNA-binding NarL/FixJ family response regulator